MQTLWGFVVIVLTAAVVENAVFARGLGIGNLADMPRDYKELLDYGVLVTALTCISGALSWLGEYALHRIVDPAVYRSHVKNPVFILSIFAAYLIVRKGLAVFWPGRFQRSEKNLAVSAFNGAVLGSILLASSQRYNLSQTLFYCLGSGAGFCVALLLIFSGRERMEISRVPRAFKGQPILLIYIGILSLAIYGLIGHQLPT